MKFENPKMNISMFEIENVVTESVPSGPKSADEATSQFIANHTQQGTPSGYKIVF